MQQQQSSRFIIPFAYRFCPTDCELLYFLYNKVNGLPLPGGSVHDCDLYGSQEPWEIWEMYGGGKLKDLYFFTALKKKSTKGKAKGKRICRRIGSGTWQGEDGPKEIKDETKKLVGWKKRFRYEKKGSEHNGGFIMLEYTLLNHDEVVLCRIKKNQEAATQTVCGRKRKKNVEEVEEAEEQFMPVPFVAGAEDLKKKLLAVDGDQRNVLESEYEWVTVEQLFPAEDDYQFPSTFVDVEEAEKQLMPVPVVASAEDHRRKLLADDGDQRNVLESEYDWVTLEQLFPEEDHHHFPSTFVYVEEAGEQLMPVDVVTAAEDHQRKLLARDGDQRNMLESESDLVTLEELFPDEDDHQFPSTSTCVDDDLSSILSYFHE